MIKVTSNDLMKAISTGDIEEIERCTANSQIDLNSIGSNNMTPLLRALVSGHFHLIPLLIAKGASLHAYDGWGETILHSACHYGNIEEVKILLAHGADINRRTMISTLPYALRPEHWISSLWSTYSFYKNTAVQWAIRHANYDLLKFLLENGADTSATYGINDTRRNPLGEAYRYFTNKEERFAAIKLLLKHGALVKDDVSILQQIVKDASEDSIALLELLFEYDAKDCLGLLEDEECTLLHCAVVSDGHEEIIRLLREYGAQVNRSEESLNQTLEEIYKNNYEYAKKGYTIGDRDPSIRISIIKLLLKHGADINAADLWDDTPLEYAISSLEFMP